MEPLTALAVALGSAWGSGLNLYATVLVLGGLDAFGVISLPDSMAVLSSTWVLAAAALLYFIEFFADKIPGLDSIWDLIHTFIRIPAGALMAAGAVGGLDFMNDELQTVAALLGGGMIAAGTHAAKAGARAVINTSPEPFSNWGMSLFEDVLVFGGLALALFNPVAFLIGLGLFALLVIWLVPKIWRGIARFFGGYKDPESLRHPKESMAGMGSAGFSGGPGDWAPPDGSGPGDAPTAGTTDIAKRPGTDPAP
ncbi:DUF4126 domain-containing protein [Thalassospiraceae bacterium LMO-SO8]|nr:DUF4126 domain-containing protein [Alphaproteobacteria bacterium LMO-S08]WND76273.1 DUF4126 domain-containing protein [Thalassospiraceae bacterium LMO-SO8]